MGEQDADVAGLAELALNLRSSWNHRLLELVSSEEFRPPMLAARDHPATSVPLETSVIRWQR